MNNEMNQNTIQVYGAGGGASNIIFELEKLHEERAPGFAIMDTCYIDTSNSNLRDKNIPADKVYLFDGLDGSGKLRKLNYEDINKQIKSILLKFKPRTFNIVIHTASGGSGSIIGSTLVSELKARGHQVVVIVIGSTDTRIEIDNTIKTLKSYEAIAHKRNSPVVLHYVENTKATPRSEVNKQVKRALSLLSGLFSGTNSELDTADLKNWLEYTTITGGQNKLASLEFAVSKEELEDTGVVVSVATLAMPEMSTRLDQTPAYQAVGYVPNCWRAGVPNSLNLIDEHPIHFCISDDFIVKSVNNLTSALRNVDDVFASRNARESLLNTGDKPTDTGILL